MIFKAFKGHKPLAINLNRLHVRSELRRCGKIEQPSRALIPANCDSMIRAELESHKKTWGLGGLWENRCNVWDGSYLDAGKKYFHLGVDFYVPAETVVSADCRLNVLKIGSDHPSVGGWGGHIVARVVGKPFVLIMGHIRPFKDLALGDTIKVGEDYARIDTPETNGGWFAHGHGQLMTPSAWEDEFMLRFDSLDGYCSLGHLHRAKQLFLDPIKSGVIEIE